MADRTTMKLPFTLEKLSESTPVTTTADVVDDTLGKTQAALNSEFNAYSTQLEEIKALAYAGL